MNRGVGMESKVWGQSLRVDRKVVDKLCFFFCLCLNNVGFGYLCIRIPLYLPRGTRIDLLILKLQNSELQYNNQKNQM